MVPARLAGVAIKYRWAGYGTRQEIRDLLTEALGEHRSQHRQEEARAALAELDRGADQVCFGIGTFHVVPDLADSGDPA